MYIYICIYKFTRNTGAPTPRVGCAPHVVYIYIYIYIYIYYIYIYIYMNIWFQCLFCMNFVVLETALKVNDISTWFWGHPRSRDHPGCREMVGSRALSSIIPGSLKPDSRDLRLRREYIGYMTHWKRDYTWSLAARWPPTRGAGEWREALLQRWTLPREPEALFYEYGGEFEGGNGQMFHRGGGRRISQNSCSTCMGALFWSNMGRHLQTSFWDHFGLQFGVILESLLKWFG